MQVLEKYLPYFFNAIITFSAAYIGGLWAMRVSRKATADAVKHQLEIIQNQKAEKYQTALVVMQAVMDTFQSIKNRRISNDMRYQEVQSLFERTTPAIVDTGNGDLIKDFLALESQCKDFLTKLDNSHMTTRIDFQFYTQGLRKKYGFLEAA